MFRNILGYICLAGAALLLGGCPATTFPPKSGAVTHSDEVMASDEQCGDMTQFAGQILEGAWENRTFSGAQPFTLLMDSNPFGTKNDPVYKTYYAVTRGDGSGWWWDVVPSTSQKAYHHAREENTLGFKYILPRSRATVTHQFCVTADGTIKGTRVVKFPPEEWRTWSSRWQTCCQTMISTATLRRYISPDKTAAVE